MEKALNESAAIMDEIIERSGHVLLILASSPSSSAGWVKEKIFPIFPKGKDDFSIQDLGYKRESHALLSALTDSRIK